jgi:hypothetical protein
MTFLSDAVVGVDSISGSALFALTAGQKPIADYPHFEYPHD